MKPISRARSYTAIRTWRGEATTGAAVVVDDVGENQRGAVEPGDPPQRRHVGLDPEVPVAVLPVRHLVAGQRLHVHVEREQVVAALHPVPDHLVEEVLDLDALAEQPPLHVREGGDDGVDRALLGLPCGARRARACRACRRDHRVWEQLPCSSPLMPRTDPISSARGEQGRDRGDRACNRAGAGRASPRRRRGDGRRGRAGQAAFPAWRSLAPAERSALLHRLADAIEVRVEDLATLEARNAGKPISDARGEMGMVVETFRYYAGGPERLTGKTIPVAGGVDMTFREPLGVVGLITPWNFPLTIASWKVAPALAAGNTVVLKPAELTPLTALELERIALEAGLPEGVLNVVAGPGSVCGQRLVEHPDVAKVAFTGSTEVGRRDRRGRGRRRSSGSPSSSAASPPT